MAEEKQVKGRKERAPQFTEEENGVLADLYVKHKSILTGSFVAVNGSNLRKRKWAEVVASVNAVGGYNRTLEQIQKKVKNELTKVKSKAVTNKSSHHKTGGGSGDEEEIDSAESKYLSTLSKRQMYGIEGGIDVHEKSFPGDKQNASGAINTESGADHKSSDLLPFEDSNISAQNDFVALFNPVDVDLNEEIEVLIDSQAPSKIITCTKTSVENGTPVSKSYEMTEAKRNLSLKRKSTLLEGPQTKLMREQVSVIGQQVESFKNIETILRELLNVEKKKLSVMEATLALKRMKSKVTPTTIDELE